LDAARISIPITATYGDLAKYNAKIPIAMKEIAIDKRRAE